eukprot:CAMPEP_0178438334 /NCGR_PEP_ID=MMETSP0689_2-20121128/35536_1 /TAXON_ID=160604 /ORGANISM="Amphidinium massartii, Strain CS-259" /LENGTH=191 /DNA_ID=CAMNT_0020060727 /DNA_START=36 /DNA_END=611 /DNA_ORIENTATION=-
MPRACLVLAAACYIVTNSALDLAFAAASADVSSSRSRLVSRRAQGSGDVEPPRSEAWISSVDLVVDNVEDATAEDAEAWLQEGFAWTRKSKRFWRTSRKEEEPVPEGVEETIEWLKAKGLARKDWIKKFPEVVGLSADDLTLSRETSPSYLKSDQVFLSAIKANPKLLGNNFDCLAESDSCRGRCARCWNT